MNNHLNPFPAASRSSSGQIDHAETTGNARARTSPAARSASVRESLTAIPTHPNHQSDELSHQIQLNLTDVHQLFNTIDPSPFPEKDLDRGVEDFIVSWTEEFPIEAPVDLVVHLKEPPAAEHENQVIEAAIHHYFVYRARLNQLEFRRLMRQGRKSLIVGISFLSACLLLSSILGPLQTQILPNFLREGFTIAGWVAMWRPMEIYLYEWWPL